MQSRIPTVNTMRLESTSRLVQDISHWYRGVQGSRESSLNGWWVVANDRDHLLRECQYRVQATERTYHYNWMSARSFQFASDIVVTGRRRQRTPSSKCCLDSGPMSCTSSTNSFVQDKLAHRLKRRRLCALNLRTSTWIIYYWKPWDLCGARWGQLCSRYAYHVSPSSYPRDYCHCSCWIQKSTSTRV